MWILVVDCFDRLDCVESVRDVTVPLVRLAMARPVATEATCLCSVFGE